MKKSSLKIPAKFGEDNYLEKIVELNNKYCRNGIVIEEVYGCIPESVMGNARAAAELDQVSKSELERFIRRGKKLNIDFDYTINSFWCNGMEFNPEGRKTIFREIDELIELGVENVTISSPGILKLLSHQYDNLNITVSINNCVDSMHAIKRWENEKVDRIVLNRHVNKDFELLCALSKSTKVKLELLTNSMCNLHCSLHQYHNMINSCNSSLSCSNIDSEYPQNQCALNMLSNMMELMCSGWIRPEDISLYERMGYHYFKLDGRCLPAEDILYISEKYLARRHNGNFFDLFDNFNERQGLPFWLELDNERLNGFVEKLQQHKVNCRICGGNRLSCKQMIDSVIVHNSRGMEIYKKMLKYTLDERN